MKDELAFPQFHYDVVRVSKNKDGNDLIEPIYIATGGLTKREYFAAMAMQGLISKLPVIDFEGEYGEKLSAQACDGFKKHVAESARGYADALIKTLKDALDE